MYREWRPLESEDSSLEMREVSSMAVCPEATDSERGAWVLYCRFQGREFESAPV